MGRVCSQRVTYICLMQLPAGKKVYFLSDFHLGAPNYEQSRLREMVLVNFLDTIAADAAAIFIVGDMFDFWYEYRHVVPKGYIRLFGRLAALADAGVAIHFFVGNHDMWVKNYFQQELGMQVYMEPARFEFNSCSFYVGHGDGLGPGDTGYKLLKKIFRNPLCQFLFGILPPAVGIGLANFFSRRSRELVTEHEAHFWGEEKEWLMIHSKAVLQLQHYDYFIYGHRHVPGMHPLPQQSTYINLGDWIKHFSYAVFDGQELMLQFFKPRGR